MSLLLTLALACPATKMLNYTKYPWNQHDKATLEVAKKRCGEIYPDAPCLKVFTKVGKQDYQVICGQ